MITWHNCNDCKYSERHTFEEPCNTCLSSECKAWELWEAKEKNSPFNSEESLKDQIRIEDSLEKGENHV